MVGYGFGGNLTLGYELYLSREMMLSLMVQGRFAGTSNIQGEFKDTQGNLHQVGLVMTSQDYLGTAYTSSIGSNGIRWANVDYTGGSAAIGLSFRY
jgi:hypothetical protein